MTKPHHVATALSTARALIKPKEEALYATRDIRLGLERIARVIKPTQTWKGVHVGGTNGKGSICGYLSALFTVAGVGHGRYTSPAFPDKRHSVVINGRYVRPEDYENAARRVEKDYRAVSIGWRLSSSQDAGSLSPFELETATAFNLFNSHGVPYGIVEVGMGGATDATNAMRRKSLTIISKIGLDHQDYLGNTIEEIAKVKAGIMRPAVPCVVDGTNEPAVLAVLKEHAESVGAPMWVTQEDSSFLQKLDQDRWQLQPYQKHNLLCAMVGFRHLFPHLDIDINRMLEMVPQLPGRLEWVGISDLTENRYNKPVLVDAAHNALGIKALADFTKEKLRQDGRPITWVIGFSTSGSKPIPEMLDMLIEPHDNVAFVEFQQGPNQPPSMPAPMGRDLLAKVLAGAEDQLYDGEPDVGNAMQWAADKAGDGHIVVTGSLYLVRDLYKLEGISRASEAGIAWPSRRELWNLSKRWRERPLTKGEYEQFRRARTAWQTSREIQALQGNGPRPQATGPESNDTATSAEVDDVTRLDPSLQAATDGQAPPKEDIEEIKRLRESEDFHLRQQEAYEDFIRSAEEDLEWESKAPTPDAAFIRQLKDDLTLFRSRENHHRKALDSIAEKIIAHPAAQRVVALTHFEVYGRPLTYQVSTFEDKPRIDRAKRIAERAARRQAYRDHAIAEKQAKKDARLAKSTDPRRSAGDGTADGAGEEEPIEEDFWGRPVNLLEQGPRPYDRARFFKIGNTRKPLE